LNEKNEPSESSIRLSPPLVSDFKAYPIPFTLQISVFVCRQQLMIQHQTNEHYICHDPVLTVVKFYSNLLFSLLPNPFVLDPLFVFAIAKGGDRYFVIFKTHKHIVSLMR
jgi:hypothetical protein